MHSGFGFVAFHLQVNAEDSPFGLRGLQQEQHQPFRLLGKPLQQGQVPHALPLLAVHAALQLKQQHVLEEEAGAINIQNGPFVCHLQSSSLSLM